MNILLLINSFDTGGAEQLTLELVRRLEGEGFHFHLACMKEEGNLAPEMRKLGVPVDAGFLMGRYDLPFGLVRAVRALRGRSFDILFSGAGRNLLWSGAWLARALRIPKRITAIHATRMWGKDRMFHPSQVRMMRRLDGVIACAETQGEFLVREEGVDGANLTVILNGVDPDRFRPAGPGGPPPLEAGPEPADRSVGIVASLTPEKGHEVFVDAATITLGDVGDARFYIVGEGPERERIEERIAAKGLAGKVILLGRRRDLPALLPRFTLLALSSHPFRETLPISTMEGMASALPTVNTEVGSVRDLVVDGETGIIVPPGDPEEMARAFTRLLEDPELAARMGRAGRRRIEERFTLDRTAEEYRRYFERIAAGGRVR